MTAAPRSVSEGGDGRYAGRQMVTAEKFLEVLASTRSVAGACKAVGISRTLA